MVENSFTKKKLIRGQKQLKMTWVFLLPLDLRRHVECGVTNTLVTFWAFVVPNYIGEKQCSNVVYGWENIQDLWILLSRDIDSSRLSQPWLSHVSSAIVKLPTQEDVSIKQIQGFHTWNFKIILTTLTWNINKINSVQCLNHYHVGATI